MVVSEKDMVTHFTIPIFHSKQYFITIFSEHLIFQGRPLTARSMSRKEIVNETVKGMSDLKSTHAIITQVEGN